MQEELITLETAILAKKAGFDWKVRHRYSINDKEAKDTHAYGMVVNFNDPCFQDVNRQYSSAPTQALLQRWLRDVHQVHITVECYLDEMNNSGDIEYQILWEGESCNAQPGTDNAFMTYKDHTFYHSFEECLEEQIRYALKCVIKPKK